MLASTFFPLTTFATAKIDYSAYEQTVRPIVNAMTLDEKLGQMIVPKFTYLQENQKINFDLINRYHLGALLAAGGEVPNGQGGVSAGMDEPKDYMNSTFSEWKKLNDQVAAHPVLLSKSTIKIPLLIGVDAVHGHQIVMGNVIFPHNIGLSMTHNPDVLYNAGKYTASDVLASGFNWIYAPTVAISHNPNWGRTNESLGSQPEWTQKYASAFVIGAQQPSDDGKLTGALATVKHYIGDGATFEGPDEGNAHVNDMEHFLQVNGAGYVGALKSDVGSLMVSYSAINELPMTFNDQLVAKNLREKSYFGKTFGGFIVSDYGAVDKASNQGLPATHSHTPYLEGLAQAINGGIDMFMLSSTATEEKTLKIFFANLKKVVQSGQVSEERINQAVTHILAVKYAMGLIGQDNQKNIRAKKLSSSEKIRAATTAAEQSLVLLKNDNAVLPLSANQLKYVVLVGESLMKVRQDDGKYLPTLFANYNNIGAQVGGWMISWQGIEGNDFWQGSYKKTSGASSVLDGIKAAAPNATLIYPVYTSMTDVRSIQFTRTVFLRELKQKYPDMDAENTVIVGVLAEPPYAEFMGDVGSPFCTDAKDADHGCLYNYHLNPYLPLQERKDLTINYDKTFDQKVIEKVKSIDEDIPVVTILFSGRSMIVNQALEKSTAFVAAWLPGTTGGAALAHALFGTYLFCDGHCGEESANTLSVNWVKSAAQLKNYPIYDQGEGFVGFSDPLFEIGYGLATHKKLKK